MGRVDNFFSAASSFFSNFVVAASNTAQRVGWEADWVAATSPMAKRTVGIVTEVTVVPLSQ
jgi:hypothetical protein